MLYTVQRRYDLRVVNKFHCDQILVYMIFPKFDENNQGDFIKTGVYRIPNLDGKLENPPIGGTFF